MRVWLIVRCVRGCLGSEGVCFGLLVCWDWGSLWWCICLSMNCLSEGRSRRCSTAIIFDTG